MAQPLPVFQSRGFLRDHIRSILDFYEPNIVSARADLEQNFYDNGSVFNSRERHLVSSCRQAYIYCEAFRLFGETRDREKAELGLKALERNHWNAAKQGYRWHITEAGEVDETNHAYGLAFVLLAHASAIHIGIESSREPLTRAWQILKRHFYLRDQRIFADEISADWSQTSDYRGQNANMHMCEALLCCFDATGNPEFLDYAYDLACVFTRDLSKQNGGFVWEHYHTDLRPDLTYNLDDPKNLYRPWGFQPGHQTEWTKLLLLLHRVRPEGWMIERAEFLFRESMRIAWDNQFGGLHYGFDLDERICDDDKYFWVQAESIAAAALLAQTTGNEKYWQDYNKLWRYCWQHFVDHQQGAWFRLLTRDNQKPSNIKSASGAKCDYHTVAACVLALGAVDQD